MDPLRLRRVARSSASSTAGESLTWRSSVVKTISSGTICSCQRSAPPLPESLTHWPGYLAAFIAEHATERFERALADQRIRSKHASVLAVIDADGAMSQRELCRRLQIDKSPMVGLVDDLEQLGLAERRRSDAALAGEADRLDTAVGVAAAALGEAELLEIVHEPDHRALVDLQPPAQFALGIAPSASIRRAPKHALRGIR